MKIGHILFLGVVAVVGLIIIYTFTGANIDDNYVADLGKFRREKNERFKQSDESPLDKAQRATFDSLHYFPANPAYRVMADLEWLGEREQVMLGNSKSGETAYIKCAQASFQLHGKLQVATLLKAADRPDDANMYLLFKDATSGKETYGGGRYVDVPAKKGQSCIIDFNMAYNPYCAYNEYYVCPIPPPENHFSVPILAGEMQYMNHEDDID